ncbi:MAG: crossover junction endodeoxyribonuclease RuvC [Candidatus Omnitrophica bacterium]|nr:crossover junction endodeoxyribonuclease RuvC [Candidatus Omnitrophota bacterium]MCM8807111.1 crossover junction endodeoxyribonuclease RuvC [Candidatus Omnitrophota bacterium]
MIGIDPGINKLGYSVIENFKILECGILKPPSKLTFEEKIEFILKNFKKILEKYLPDIVSIEEVYVAKNVKTALNMGILVGGIISVILSYNIKFFLIPPSEIKKMITGKGSATKEQVKFMVENLTNFYNFKNFEETDATASAISAIFKLKEKCFTL